ncbi:hypothetical protein AQUCO_03500021v1 [Aquilegia coerulea]|uniref:AT3G52170-like helix-turn-helix domain-containing protein n=1 Tax=Aquilegia coerulea TaxID=218851 RepID=A0A2G5CVP4_AQUCA|nr:hypothetical protein AQUCO_03500021v1 [Aquilegia coerulea]
MQAAIRGGLRLRLRRSAFSSKTTITSSSSSSSSSCIRSSLIYKRVFTHISNASNTPCCRPTSFPSSSTPQTLPKRVSKHQRRTMLKAFVDKYRASNQGKYPTPSAARKQVGGSYYVVKKILQEIEYNSQRSTVVLNTINEAPFEKVVPQEECPPSPEATEIPRSATGEDLTSSAHSLGLKDDSQTVAITNMDMDEAPSSTNQTKEETLGTTEMPVLKEAVNASNSDETHSHFKTLKSKEVSHIGIENPEENQAVTSEGSLDLNEPKIVQEDDQEAFKSSSLKRDIARKETEEDHSLPMRATVWGNLKSLADGIINMWRKM